MYESRVEHITSLKAVDVYAQDGFVITAATAHAQGYTVWAFKPKNSPIVYEGVAERVAREALPSFASTRAEQGFVITAMVTEAESNTDTNIYVVFAFKRVGSDKTYRADVARVYAGQVVLQSYAENYALQGYVITAASINDSGTYTTVAFKRVGSTDVYSANVDVSDRVLSSVRVTTAAVRTWFGYTAWNFAPADATYWPSRRQLVDDELRSTTAADASDGFVTTAAIANPDGYVTWAAR